MNVTTLAQPSSELLEEIRNGSGNSPGLLNVLPFPMNWSKTAWVEVSLLNMMGLYPILDPSPVPIDASLGPFNGILDPNFIKTVAYIYE